MNIVNKILFGLGLCSILLGIPITQILANNFNFFTANNYFMEISIFLVLFIILLKFFYDKIKVKSKILIKTVNIIFFQIINFYIIKYTEIFFNEYSTTFKLLLCPITTLIFFIIAILINNKILAISIKYLSILFFFQFILIIYYNLNFNTNQNKKNTQNISNINNVFLIILDEVSFNFITNENEKIKDDFINLKQFENNSTFFTNAHSSFDFTSKAILSVLSFGESLNNEIIENKNHYFKDLNLYNNNLYKELAKTHNINVFASYNYCYYHIKFINYCISNINKNADLINSLKSYFYSIYLYITPQFIINRLHNLNIINKDRSLENYFTNEINLIDHFINYINLSPNEKNLYLLHTNLTHQPWVLDENGNINLEHAIKEEDKIKNISKLKNYYYKSILYTDKKLGEIFNFLKDKNIYDESLIIITSDHGISFDENIFLRMNGKINNQISKVPLIIKKPLQKKGKIIKEYVNIIDIGSTLINMLNNNNVKFNYSRNLFDNSSLDQVNIPFLSVKEEYDITGKIIYKKNTYCKNFNGEYELIHNETFNNIFNICID